MATLGLCVLRFSVSFTNFSFLLQQLYTAFFKNIEKQLKDKEFIFSVLKFLGYTERDEHKVYIKDSGRRNPVWASFNLFLLQVELQIMEEIQSQNSSRNIPLKEIVKARSKKRTIEEAIRYVDRKSSSKQPELDERQGDDASSYKFTRGTSNDNIKARARLPGELASRDQTTTSSYSGSSANPSGLSKATDSGAANASNRSNEPTFRNGYVRTALPHHKLPLGGVDSVQITDNALYGVNPEESQPGRASAYDKEVRDQNSSRYDDASRSATFREKTGNSQHVTTPSTGRPQYPANTKGGQQHGAHSSHYTFNQLGSPHSTRLTNGHNNGHSFNSSAEAGASVHDINTSRYVNLRYNAGSDCQNIGCSGSDKSLPTKEGERRFEDRLPIIQQTHISRSAQGLVGMEGDTHVRSSNHLSSSDEPSNVGKAAKAPQQQKNMSSGHRRQEHIPSAEEAAKSRQAHRSQVDIENPVASTGVYNVSSGATEGRNHLPTNRDSTRKEDGTAYHSPPFQVQNLTQGSVKGSQTGAVSVAQTTSSHEAHVVEQAKHFGNNVCEHCLLAASCICRFCHHLVCGKCKEVYSVDVCAVTKGEHEFANLKASEGKGEQGIGMSGEEWSCLRCTYVNPAENKICAMCSTTRGLSAVELSKPGTRVCNWCTSHNQENAKICYVCSRSLDLNCLETVI